MSKEALFVISLITACISITSGFIGMLDGNIHNDCSTYSIASRINIPYRLGCEFTKPRFKKDKP